MSQQFSFGSETGLHFARDVKFSSFCPASSTSGIWFRLDEALQTNWVAIRIHSADPFGPAIRLQLIKATRYVALGYRIVSHCEKGLFFLVSLYYIIYIYIIYITHLYNMSYRQLLNFTCIIKYACIYIYIYMHSI